MEIIWRDGEMGNGFLNGCRSVPFKNVECKSVQDERIQENEQIGFFGNPFTAARERIFVNEFVQRNQSIIHSSNKKKYVRFAGRVVHSKVKGSNVDFLFFLS